MKRERSTTMQDVANRAGISKVTVSAVLGGRSKDLRIAEATQQRVWQIAREMNYRPNEVARSLRRQRTNILGFYSAFSSHNARNDFLGDIIGGLQTASYAVEQDILLHRTCVGRPVDAVFAEMVDGRIDGIFLHASLEDPLVSRLAASNVPVVGIADFLPGIPSVSCDNEEGIRLLVSYLWERGHRRIAFLAPTLQLASVEARGVAFQHEMQMRGMADEEAPILRMDMDMEYAYLKTVLSREPRPTALCCWHDGLAYSVLRGCNALNIHVPDELAVVGFNGYLDLMLPIKNLVTIDARWAEVAQTAMTIMMEQIRGAEVAIETRLPVRLIPGDTA